MRIEIKPLSVNEAWQGRRYKTDTYNGYAKHLAMLLPPLRIDFKKQLKVAIVFGFSSHGSDIDNPVKPLIDVLQKKYGFDDNQIYEMVLKKEVVAKGNEFIELEITEL